MAVALGRPLGNGRGDQGGSARGADRRGSAARDADQLALFTAPHPVIERLRELDVNTMTPLQALEQLARLIEQARASHGNG
jgi:hypothetical protein